jgi:hypothetical protein
MKTNDENKARSKQSIGWKVKIGWVIRDYSGKVYYVCE